MYQLKKLINRRNVVKDPSKGVAPCEEFFLLVVETHVLAAAMHLIQMTSLDDTPTSTYFPIGSEDLGSLERRRILMKALKVMLVSVVVCQYVDLTVTYDSQPQPTDDHVRAYACEVVSLGLLLMEFNYAIRKGDGTRILHCWHFFLLLFKASGRKNYAIEALILLTQHRYLFIPRMAKQLQWSRTINVHGQPGKNIAADLHMEHLNHACKEAISRLGANITDHSVERVGRCLGRLQLILQRYDKDNDIREVSGSHSKRSATVDLNKMLKQLTKSAVFESHPGRAHRHFPKFTTNLVRKVSKEKLMQWMHSHIKKPV